MTWGSMSTTTAVTSLDSERAKRSAASVPRCTPETGTTTLCRSREARSSHLSGASLPATAAAPPSIVTLDRVKHPDKDGDQQDDDPGAVNELGGDDDQHHDPGRQRAHAVDGRLPPPARSRLSVPMAHHARLRQREGEKDAHCVERNEPVGLPAKENDQTRSQESQGDDAVGKDQPVAQVGELAGQVPAARMADSRGKPAKEVLAARIRMSVVATCRAR